MAVVMGAMGTLLPKLEEMLKEEYKLHKSAMEEIMLLKTELDSLHSVLLEVSTKPVDQLNVQVKLWMKEARELSYDIEDGIDIFMMRASTSSPKPPNLKGFIQRCLHLLTKANICREINTEIRDLRNLTGEVAKLCGQRNADWFVVESVASTVDPRASVYTKVKELVGIDEARDELLAKLIEGNSMDHLKVISIFGLAGLGKTALANTVYQKIKAHFDCGAFVSVSHNPDVAEILKHMLCQFDNVKYANITEATWDERKLLNEIGEFLMNKSYLVVIDDIWDISVWERIRLPFIDNNHGNRIITTTRKSDVAKQVGGAYKLKPLSFNNSRALFYRGMFGPEKERLDNELTEVSDRILSKCGGIPLAITTLSSLLDSKPRNVREWIKLFDSIGVGIENSPQVNDMRRIFALSYYDLPYHLRTCLLFTRMFPENYKIKRDQLVLMWIAEGFVQGDNLFKHDGESYFDELIDRSMLQPAFTDATDRTEVCFVHSVVLDLISYFAAQEDFVTVLDDDQRTSIPTKVRRLSLQRRKVEHSTAENTASLSQVRSLTVFSGAFSSVPPLSSFQALRVLNMEGCDLSESYNLKDVGNLCHLRYLGLRDSRITKLPEEIGNLQFLQTLDIRGYTTATTSMIGGAKQVPASIVRLRHLVCLYVDKDTRLPEGLGNIKSLKELLVVNASKSPDVMKELSHLTELRVLEIYWIKTLDLRLQKALVDSLWNLQKMESLSISTWSTSCSDFMQEGWAPPEHLRTFRAAVASWFSVLPIWIDPAIIPNLSALDVEVKRLRQEDIEILGRLPALGCLRLTIPAEEEGRKDRLVVGGADAFRCLRECRVWNGTGLVFQGRAMPRVHRLELNLNVRETSYVNGGFDLGLNNLPSLEHVTLQLDRQNAWPCLVDEAETALRAAIDTHPNHPTLYIEKTGTASQQAEHMEMESPQDSSACTLM